MEKNQLITKCDQAFVLADGLAPFHVLGTVQLSIIFAGRPTSIQAYVAQNLCTDVILGMDYIRLYDVQIDTRKQLVSIQLHNRRQYISN